MAIKIKFVPVFMKQYKCESNMGNINIRIETEKNIKLFNSYLNMQHIKQRIVNKYRKKNP